MDELVWPEGILPSSFEWYLNSNGSAFESPWNKQTQTVRFPGSRWEAKMTLNNQDDLESREIEAIIVELDGMAGRIRLRDFGRWGSAPKGTPVVNGGLQTGTTINTSGWTPNVKVLSRGDYATIGGELKMILKDVTSDESGNAALKIGPQMRNSPTAGSAIEVQNPYGIFRLEDGNNGVKRDPGFNNNITLNFVEAF